MEDTQLQRQLNEHLSRLSPDERQQFEQKISYQPKIAILGKTGVGKSSLANAIFGKPVCKISDVAACTREPKEIFQKITTNGHGVRLLDVPGIGENAQRDQEYAKLYAEILAEADMILWVIKSDDRTFTSDEEFYQHFVQPHQGKPFAVAVNQVDKIEPYREWDLANRQPGPNQSKNIHTKLCYVARQFNGLHTDQVIAVSATQEYQLDKLVLALVAELPPEKRYTTLQDVNKPIQDSVGVQKLGQDSLAEFLPWPLLGMAPFLLMTLWEDGLENVLDVGDVIITGVGEVIEDIGDTVVDAIESGVDLIVDLFDW